MTQITITKRERELRAAQKLYDFSDPWERDDMTVADFAKVIHENAPEVIEHLLEVIADLMA